MHSPFDREPHQLQVILVVKPDGEIPSDIHLFRGK
jgi:hypothetical protein